MLKVVVLLKRKPGMSREDFVRYYESRHAVLATELVPGLLDYRRTYVSGERPAFGAAPDSLDFDVITTLVFADRAAYEHAFHTLQRPEIARRIADDEEQLFDRSCIRSYLAEEYVSDLANATYVPNMDAASRLLAIEEIKQLKARYFRFMDSKDWAGLRTIFCDDAVFDARASLSIDGHGKEGRAAESNTWVYRNGDVIVDFIKGAIGSARTVHHGHCHEIEITSLNQASGVIAMEDQIWDEAGQVLTLHGGGHYHETYRRVDGRWRILTSRITRLHVSLGG
jgi:uncharacterized protein (TIGR02118 family)